MDHPIQRREEYQNRAAGLRGGYSDSGPSASGGSSMVVQIPSFRLRHEHSEVVDIEVDADDGSSGFALHDSCLKKRREKLKGAIRRATPQIHNSSAPFPYQSEPNAHRFSLSAQKARLSAWRMSSE